MREIKFRAWCIKEKAYIAGFNMYGFSNYQGGETLLQRFDTEWLKEEFILEQYTGLKDKNGKEIYENARVELDSFNPKEYTVEFIEGAFCFTHPNIKDYPIDINMVYGSTGPNITVIGNIHEEDK